MDKDPMTAEDMGALDAAIADVRSNAALRFTSRTCSKESTDLVMREYDRMRRKLDSISNGETVMILSDDDRAKAIMDLDDAALVAWVRPTLVFLHNAQAKVTAEKGEADRPITATIAMQGVVSMASLLTRANAAHARYAVSGITDRDKELGDWEVIIQRVGYKGDD